VIIISRLVSRNRTVWERDVRHTRRKPRKCDILAFFSD
jgi:hypothetical protein